MSDSFIYTDVEKALLQYIISVGSVREESLAAIYGKLKACENERLAFIEGFTERRLDATIEQINDRLHLLGYEVTKTKSQDTQEINYVFVNTINDTPSKISTTHSPKEIEVIKKIIETIIVESEEESFVITSSDALKICSRTAQLGPSDSERLLRELVNEGWLNRSHKGRYSLSIKALAELKRTLIDKYGLRSKDSLEGRITLCTGCNEIVTNGVGCFEEGCYVKFHSECQGLYFRAKGTQCPNEDCPVDWAKDTPRAVGEKRLRSK